MSPALRSGWALVLAAFAGCGGPAPASKPGAPRDPLSDARAAERGRGVPRDYAHAARIYDRACEGGRGDRTACRRLLHALVDGRGVDVDKARAVEIATVLCERTSDRLGCVIAGLAARRELSPAVRRAIEASGESGCDAAHLDVCEVGIDLFRMNQSSTHEHEVVAFAVRACTLDVIEMCVQLLGASKASDEERSLAKRQLTASCDLGDADACAALHGREVSWRALCEAHDYRACVYAKCLGDARAERLRGDHRSDANCREVAAIEAARNPPPEPAP